MTKIREVTATERKGLSESRSRHQRTGEEEHLRRLESLLIKRIKQELGRKESYQQPYGNLIALNTTRTLVDAVGEEVLGDIVSDFLDLLETSAAVYERDGSYAFGIFSSGWCRLLDQASRNLCHTEDNQEALASGKWLCHESCWTEASKVSIETGQHVDIECHGGIHLYAVPIWAGGEIVGSITFGYGDPPQDPQKLAQISKKYRLSADNLLEQAKAYESRPPFITEIAKRRLVTSAKLIGAMVERKRAEEELKKSQQKLEIQVAERTKELSEANRELQIKITELKRAEEALQADRKRLFSLLDGLPVFVYLQAADHFIRFSNRYFRERFGAAEGRFCYEVLLGRKEPCEDCPTFRVFATKTPQQWEWKSPDGRLYDIYDYPFTDIDGSSLVLELGIDITERRQAETALMEAKNLLEKTFASLREAVFVVEPNTRTIIACNPAVEKIFGYSEKEVTGRNTEFLHVDRESYEEFGKNLFPALNASGVYNTEFRVRRKDGSIILTDHTVTEIVDDAGHRTGLVSVIRDITEQKQAEENLRKSEERFRAIADYTYAWESWFSPEGKLLWVNPAVECLTGYSVEECMAMPDYPLQLIYEDDLGMIGEALAKAVKERTTIDDLSFRIRRKDGMIRWMAVSWQPIYDNKATYTGLRSSMRDINERVRMQEMMTQSEKMLSVGGLAAGMAHEINNPLGGIMQNASVLKRLLAEDIPANSSVAARCGTNMAAIRAYMEKRGILRMLDLIHESGSRATKIVRNMLSFSRKREMTVHNYDLAELLDETVNLATADYDLKKKYDFRHIAIIREYNPETPKVPCECGQVQQVFFNIIKNGAEAMHERQDRAEPPRFILRVLPDDDMARVEIEDNGPGMDEAIRKHVFEPFFTTKEVGLGTGLGLSVSYFIVVEHHGGTITVESIPGKGTKFIIRLPVIMRK